MACEGLNRGIFVEAAFPVNAGFVANEIVAARAGFGVILRRSRMEALLSESEDWSFGGRRSATPFRLPHVPRVTFDRRELDAILRVYGRKVSEGEWRDYAIDHLEDRAVFSIFRRASEMPMFRVEKIPGLARKQGAYRIIAASGAILRRGHELVAVLRILDKPKLSLVSG
jgi:hypothetical protein